MPDLESQVLIAARRQHRQRRAHCQPKARQSVRHVQRSTLRSAGCGPPSRSLSPTRSIGQGDSCGARWWPAAQAPQAVTGSPCRAGARSPFSLRVLTPALLSQHTTLHPRLPLSPTPTAGAPGWAGGPVPASSPHSPRSRCRGGLPSTRTLVVPSDERGENRARLDRRYRARAAVRRRLRRRPHTRRSLEEQEGGRQ